MPHGLSPWVPPGSHADVLHPATPADWDALVDVYAAPNTPFASVLGVARESGCQTIVVEYRYIDIDFRSEHAAFWSTRFNVPSPFTRRLHFFSKKITSRQLHRLPKDPGYLGYAVLRPMRHGRVGRTVLAAPPRLGDATLTAITESVSLFGNDLSVEGVPFCEQDIVYLRCAQAAVWICHYVAVRRDLVGRASTASIVNLVPPGLSVERALPSKGMLLNEIQAVFGALGQPGLFYGFTQLPHVEGVKVPSPLIDPATNKPKPAGYWDTRCISIICRYLNAHFPVLVAGDGHALVLVGWKRRPDGKVTFIACDDQVGPYEEILDPFAHYRSPWHSIVVALPPKVFLTGEAAENDAYKTFRGLWATNPGTKPIADALANREIQLRTRLKHVRAFKREIAEQTSSAKVLRAIRLMQLPHFVWVVEAHLQSACGHGNCVIGTILYDATSGDHDPQCCAISVPGAVALFDPDKATPQILPAGYDLGHSMLSAH